QGDLLPSFELAVHHDPGKLFGSVELQQGLWCSRLRWWSGTGSVRGQRSSASAEGRGCSGSEGLVAEPTRLAPS
ncbi:MAG TPA: hypothetical protein VK137_06440, partial [Planctomycetaceae bacterium]|nr:hypothetical protein [Planctomycetaceae bacterium]